MITRQSPGIGKAVLGYMDHLKNLNSPNQQQHFITGTLTQTTGFHARGSVHRVAKQTVARHYQSDHPGYTGT